MKKLLICLLMLLFLPNIVMAESVFKKDSTSKLIEIFISDSSSLIGGGLTGLVYNTSGLTAYYYCSGTMATSITLATMTVGTWATGGFIQIDATNMPGWYQFGIPNAAIASGCGDDSNIHFKGAANMVPLPFAISLVDNLESDTYAKVDTEVAAILDDTGTSGVITASGTVTTVTNAVTVGSIVTIITAPDNASSWYIKLNGTSYITANGDYKGFYLYCNTLKTEREIVDSVNGVSDYIILERGFPFPSNPVSETCDIVRR